MLIEKLDNFDADAFLQTYWQKKHYLIPSALPDFINPITADELAGLSLEDDAESRVIIESPEATYQVQHGPFTSDYFSQLPESHWTLLVQAVDHWLDDINQLKRLFRFIPDWRIDDIMISYAPVGGSVGPHFDYYDVFLIQASGSREWKIGQQCDSQTQLDNNTDMKILKHFETQETYAVEAGDILYIPPGCAHWGSSTSNDCITLSIGFRAPSHEELIANICDDIASQLTADLRYTDTPESENAHPANIPASVIENIKHTLLKHLTNNKSIAESFGKLMTQAKYPDDFSTWPCHSNQLILRPDARLAYTINDATLYIFANGIMITTSIKHEKFVQYLSDQASINLESFSEEQLIIAKELISLGVYEDADSH